MATGCASHTATVAPAEPRMLVAQAGQPLPLTQATPGPAPEAPDDDALLKDDWALLENDTSGEFYSVADPLEAYNRAIFAFNDKFYFWVLKPAAKGYRAVVPQTVRTGVFNFFKNLAAPIRLVNSVLQRKGHTAETEFARFLYNSTVGVLGFGNPAKNHPELETDGEDLGQTLAAYGLGDGFYIVWPALGPSTLRDSFGMAGDWFIDPVWWVEPLAASLVLSSYRILNEASFRIGDYESLKKAALDPYASMRDGYIQLRQSKINR
jgi:phospholipid-binding lipoprotein MlaA